ncbi:MAG: hypothetical protein FWE90_09120 [Defluviitaleaceae bacterium]|nr:hypothetical protein [Defluviitaleaceae bacterium]
MTTAERVILIQGDANKWYDQAIFIVKPHAPRHEVPVDMVAEAEKIIHNYMIKNKKPLPAGFPPTQVTGYAPEAPPLPAKRLPGRRDFFINIAMILACLVIAGLLAYGMFN